MSRGPFRPRPGPPVRFARDFGQRFLVTVDTEEEFDWGQPFARTGYGLSHVPHLAAFQSFCESHGVAPTYLIDHPVATDGAIRTALGDAVAAGRADIGVQLHPWVSPPHGETLSVHNSFAGNLPPELEQAKLCALNQALVDAFGTAPLIYRAGRYGIGHASTDALAHTDIAIDTSVRSHFDYSAQGGPDFTGLPVRPWWVGRAGGLIELPLTTMFTGTLRRWGGPLFRHAERIPHLRGALARMGLLNRVPLTPEGVPLPEALRGLDHAIDDGVPVIVFSFHSPSLVPGHTPYVRTDADLAAMMQWWEAAFAHCASRGVRPVRVPEIIAAAST